MPGTKFSYGNKSGFAGLKSKILQPALTSHYEVEIPVGSGTLNTLLTDIAPADDQKTLGISCSEASLPGSSIATFELKNDYAGVTERYAHRRMYDDRIDFTFYVDTQKYLPIRFFERWMRYVTGESGPRTDTDERNLVNVGYHYRMNFPEEYRCERGLKITKFEKDYRNSLEYEFIGAYPVAVNSMPVSYDSSGLLKCTVSMTYLRYVITELIGPPEQPGTSTQTQRPQQKNTQEPPVPQAKESKVRESFDIRDRDVTARASYDPRLKSERERMKRLRAESE